jgi:hypothetical protein
MSPRQQQSTGNRARPTLRFHAVRESRSPVLFPTSSNAVPSTSFPYSTTALPRSISRQYLTCHHAQVRKEARHMMQTLPEYPKVTQSCCKHTACEIGNARRTTCKGCTSFCRCGIRSVVFILSTKARLAATSNVCRVQCLSDNA